jgi:hypothetical protein
MNKKEGFCVILDYAFCVIQPEQVSKEAICFPEKDMRRSMRRRTYNCSPPVLPKPGRDLRANFLLRRKILWNIERTA